MAAVRFTRNSRFGCLIFTGLILGVVCFRVQIVQGQVPLSQFIGQESVYEWITIGNNTGWFSNHDDVTRITATITHTVSSLNAENSTVMVDIRGRVDWPIDSINRCIYIATLNWTSLLILDYNWTRLETTNTFNYSYSAIVDYLGRVQVLDGPTELRTEYAFPDESCLKGESLLQDWPQTRTLYFCHDLLVPVGDIVGVWRDTNAHVMSHEQRTTPFGMRPAVEIGRFYSGNFWDIPQESWVDYTVNSTFVYDQETGFLLDFLHQSVSSHNESRMTSEYHVQLLQTNMYLPRWEQLFPFVMLGTILAVFGVVLIVIALHFYRSY
ncbi:MAG: hypothetical protein Q6361_00705 [Candidatus Hermodarchaeota archaeon]|nr:hypothetical protein [Candidatus Hermodarchaeota archaeon]